MNPSLKGKVHKETVGFLILRSPTIYNLPTNYKYGR